MQTHDLVLPALTDSEREQYWAEAKLYAALFGVRPADLPADWTSFAAYTEAMSRSDSLAVSPAARDIAQQIFSGSATGLRVPGWYRALTAHLLPERLREEFGFEFGEREARSMKRALAWIRRIYPRLPMRLRAVGPYQEALARLQGDQAAGPRRALAQPALDRPADDGMMLPLLVARMSEAKSGAVLRGSRISLR